MKQLEFFDIASPCIGVCQSGAAGYCLGCFRSREERLHWLELDQDIKSKIVKACGERKKRAGSKKANKPRVQGKGLQGNLLDEESDNI
ncbi:MAG: putative Fe-S protein YdhL (DUF1289 family) [Paraglaciecola sp.]